MDDQYTQFAEQSVALYDGNPDQEAAERIRIAKLKAAADGIVGRLSRLANDTALKRKDIERRWIRDLCQYYGVRSPHEIVATKEEPLGSTTSDTSNTRSQVFVNITRAKTNRTEGRLFDMLFPADDRNWGIQPTPRPELDTVAKRAVEEAERAVSEANRLQANPDATSPTGMSPDQLLEVASDVAPQGATAQKELDEAKRRGERMATEIDDQLVEARYPQKARDAIGWACKIGVGVLKGPVVMDGGRSAWMKQEDGSHVLQSSGEKARPTIEHVNPWSFFPDFSATSMDDAEYVFERHIVNKRELRKMGRKLGFFEDALRELIVEGPQQGLGEDTQHLKDMRLLTGESAEISNRYVVWEYHGGLECDEIEKLLRAAGEDERADSFRDEMDPYNEYRVIAYFCDNKLLKLAEYYPMESGDFIYSVFSLEKGVASILGAIGQVRKMKDSQGVLDAAWRMMMDNARLAIGPQVLIDKAKVTPEDGNWTMYPGKVWNWDSHNSGGQGQAEPFKVFTIPMNQEACAGIIALAKAFIDDETAMPSLIEGGANEERAPGAASTVGGFAMLLNAAGVDPRRMVKNWDDDVTTGIVTRLYHWNMQYSDKDEIKGDMQVEARGVSVLLQREMQAPHLLTAATTMTVHPVLGPAHKPYDVLRLTYQALGINPSDVLVEREEYEAKMQKMAEQTEPEDPQWAVRERIAQIDNETRRYVADKTQETAMLELAESSKLSIAEIQAQLADTQVKAGVDVEKTRIAADSSERKLAAEIAVEQRIAAEARAQGEQPPGSGGTISGGSKPK